MLHLTLVHFLRTITKVSLFGCRAKMMTELPAIISVVPLMESPFAKSVFLHIVTNSNPNMQFLQWGHSSSVVLNKWLHEKPQQLDSSWLVFLHSRFKSPLWCILLKVMHAFNAGVCTVSVPARVYVEMTNCTLRPCWKCACRLKKEMGLGHVNEDYNHRKQEHNCLEYTGSRQCITREGQEDSASAVMRQRYLLVEHQKFSEEELRQGHFFLPEMFFWMFFL